MEKLKSVWIGRTPQHWMLTAFADKKFAQAWASEVPAENRTIQEFVPQNDPVRVSSHQPDVVYTEETVYEI